MSVTKTKTGSWRVRVDVGYDINGQRARRDKTVKTKREAVALEAMWRELARTDDTLAKRIHFDNFVEEFYMPIKREQVRANTLRGYIRDLNNRLLPAFGDMYLDEIDKQAVQRMLNACSTYKVAHNAKTTLKTILTEAVELGYIASNVAKMRYTMPKRELFPEDHNGVWLTSFIDIDRFCEQIDAEHYKTPCMLGFNLGLRRGEIFALDWDDVDFASGYIHVNKTYVSEKNGFELLPPKTRASVRIIPMRKHLMQYLETLENKSGAICKNKDGKRANPATTARNYEQYIKRRGLEYVTFLNFRHSFATSCLNAGIDVTKVSKLLGHTNISTTVSRYIRFTPEDIREEFWAKL